MEVDQLKDRDKVQFLKDLKNTPILLVYQSKLAAVRPRYRWKLIPLFLKEQKKAITIIKNGNFERPLNKTLKRYFGK